MRPHRMPAPRSLTVAAVLAATAVLLPPAAAQDRPTDGPTDRHTHRATWTETVLDADQSFRGLDAVDRRTAWVTGGSASGADGSVWRTTDGGETWESVGPPDAGGLLFRDVEARDADTAVVLAIGEGEASRIYRTDDGGQSWTETFRNPDPTAFYNCLDLYRDGRHGLAVSDPVDGRFRIIATRDGGRSWDVLPDDGMPDSTGQFNFAASGDCLVFSGRTAHFGTGGAAAQVFSSRDFGRTWRATDSALRAGEAAGVFGLAFRTPRRGVAVGGDFDPEATAPDGSAYTTDARTWRAGGDLAHLGEDAAWVSRRLVVATGESGPEAGTSVSTDGGRRWQQVSERGYHTLDCPRGSCWAAGGAGRVARLGR